MFETMAEIEGVCSRLAAQRITPDQIDGLRKVHHDCEQAVEAHDAQAYAQYNETFHHIIYSMSGNTFLEQHAAHLFRLLKPFRRLQFQTHGRMAASLAEHVSLLRALTAGDHDMAAACARAHVSDQSDRYLEQVASRRRSQEIRSAS
jgi:DNA-binding GntR family transcriptional regulator